MFCLDSGAGSCAFTTPPKTDPFVFWVSIGTTVCAQEKMVRQYVYDVAGDDFNEPHRLAHRARTTSFDALGSFAGNKAKGSHDGRVARWRATSSGQAGRWNGAGCCAGCPRSSSERQPCSWGSRAYGAHGEPMGPTLQTFGPAGPLVAAAHAVMRPWGYVECS